MDNAERHQNASQELSTLGGEERVARFLQLFPTFEEQRGFLAWDAARLDANRPRGLTAAEFVDLIDNKRGLVQEPAARELALGMIRSGLQTPVGSDNKFLYRLTLDPYALIPQDGNLSCYTTDGSNQSLISRYVLGVNTAVQPALPAVPASRRQQQNLPETSTRSAETEGDDDNQAPGFIFYQLGLLEASQHNWKDKEPWSQTAVQEAVEYLGEDRDPDLWFKTGFHLVARIGATSKKCEGIYAIFNMWPRNPDARRYEQITHSEWGIPPTGEHQFSVARISRALGELGYMREMRWEERVEHPVELVRVRPAGNILGAARLTV